MSKRTWLNLVMFIVLLGLGLLVVYQPGVEQEPPAVKLTALKAAELNSLTLDRTGDETITLQREGGHWRLTAPLQVAANETRLNAVLNIAEAAVESQFEIKKDELAKYGLDRPAARLRLNDTELVFGDASPLGGKRYVMTGATVAMIDENNFAALLGNATLFVSRNLVPPGRGLTGIRLPDRELRRNESGQWSMQPAQEDVSADAITGLVEEWRNVQALRLEKYRHAQAAGEVVLHVEGETAPVHLLIIATQPELTLARPDVGLQYSFSQDQATRLLQFVKPGQAEQEGQP